MPGALYYRQQAERYARVADQCSIPDLVPYYQKLALDCVAQAMRAEGEPAEKRQKSSRRRRPVAER